MTTIDLAADFTGTDLSNAEVFGIGVALLDSAAAVFRLGHASPNSLLDYWTTVSSTSEAILRDYVAWATNRNDAVPGSPRERLRRVVEESGWHEQQLGRLATLIGHRCAPSGGSREPRSLPRFGAPGT